MKQVPTRIHSQHKSKQSYVPDLWKVSMAHLEPRRVKECKDDHNSKMDAGSRITITSRNSNESKVNG